MGVAFLGFSGGPQMTFRIDPTSIDVSYNIHTSVQDTVGGRVIQITGASIADITVAGTVGEDRTRGKGSGVAEPGRDHPGVGWKLATEFFNTIKSMMQFQSANVDKPATAIPTATFSYAPLNIKLPVYIKALSDPDGDGTSGMFNRSGKYLFRYQLTLFPVDAKGQTLIQAGQSGSTFDQKKAAAIQAYLNRITGTNGFGWKPTIYNGGLGNGATLVQLAPAASPSTSGGGGGGGGNAGAPQGGVSSAGQISVSQVTYGQYTGGGDVAGWITAACQALGITNTGPWVTGYQTAISRESSGNANAVNTSDSNATGANVADGHPANCSRGVAQCIPPTFASNHAANTSTDIYDPVANIAASMNYVMRTYGVSKDGSNLASNVQQFDPNRSPKGY